MCFEEERIYIKIPQYLTYLAQSCSMWLNMAKYSFKVKNQVNVLLDDLF